MKLSYRPFLINADQKEQLANDVITFVNNNRAVDLRVFLVDELDFTTVNPDLVSEIAAIIRQQKEYKLVPEGVGSQFTYIITKETWRERNPLAAEIRVGIITAIFSLLVGWLLWQLDTQGKDQKYKLQDERLNRLDDSIRNLEMHLADSIAKLRDEIPMNVTPAPR